MAEAKITEIPATQPTAKGYFLRGRFGEDAVQISVHQEGNLNFGPTKSTYVVTHLVFVFPTTLSEIERVASHFCGAYDAELVTHVPGIVGELRQIRDAPTQQKVPPGAGVN